MFHLRLSIWRVFPVMLALFAIAGPISLRAATVVQSTFTFSGLCSDCFYDDESDTYGRATATLTLTGYTLGQSLANENLVSFVYDPTDLIPGGFTILPADLNYMTGMFLSSSPGWADFAIGSGQGPTFESDIDGNWRVMLASDEGTDGRWSGAAAGPESVPEPAAFLLVAAGLGVLSLRRWKQRS